MLVVAAPIVFESPTELTTPPEVVLRRADRSLFSFSSRLPRKLVDILVIETTPVSRERVHSSVLLHWSRFYTPPDAARSREGCPRVQHPSPECSEHPSGRRRHWRGGAGAAGVVR